MTSPDYDDVEQESLGGEESVAAIVLVAGDEYLER
jgi:hypothetical protein